MHKRNAEARRWFQQACYDLKDKGDVEMSAEGI